VGRWSQKVASTFVEWLAVEPGRRWLDLGCGTGALSLAIAELASPELLIGLDTSKEYISNAKERVAGVTRSFFLVADARALPLCDATCDAIVSGLALNFVPSSNQLAAVVAMRQAVRPEGVVAAYVWDYAGQMQFMRYFWDAAAALDPAAQALDEGMRFPICNPDALTALFHDAGLAKVEARPIDVPTVFRDFDDFWAPFLGGQGPAPGYVRSLPAHHRIKLRDHLRAMLPVSPGGSIPLIARAWAIRGHRRD
jgi:SAM-dependent methyltransferase